MRVSQKKEKMLFRESEGGEGSEALSKCKVVKRAEVEKKGDAILRGLETGSQDIAFWGRRRNTWAIIV